MAGPAVGPSCGRDARAGAGVPRRAARSWWTILARVHRVLSAAVLASAILAASQGLPAAPDADAAERASEAGVRVSTSVEALVTNQTGDTLSVVRLADMTQVAEIAIGGKPAGVAMSPDGLTAYVTSPEGRMLNVIDVAARTVVARLEAGSGPLGVAVNPVSGAVYVADWYRHRIRAFDPGGRGPAGLKAAGEVEVGRSPSGLAVTPDGRHLLSADRDSDRVSVVDTRTLAVTGTVAVGQRPFGVTISGDGRRAYTANVGSNDVTVIDIAGLSVIGRVPVGRRPYAVALAAGRAFVTDQHAASVTVFDVASLARIKTIRVGAYPEGIAADRDGRTVYVACWDANTLERIDTATLEVTGRVTVGDGPRAFGLFLR